MEKIWYIYVDGHQEGPISLEALIEDKRLTLDTFVFQEAFTEWKQIRFIEELVEFFDKSKPLSEEDQTANTEFADPLACEEELTLALKQEPPFYGIIIIIIVLLLFYLIKIF